MLFVFVCKIQVDVLLAPPEADPEADPEAVADPAAAVELVPLGAGATETVTPLLATTMPFAGTVIVVQYVVVIIC